MGKDGLFWDLSWDIKIQSIPFNPVSNICRLCLSEKYMILFEPVDASLNQRSEFFTVCRHKEAWLLVNRKWKSNLHFLQLLSYLNYLSIYLFNQWLFPFGTVMLFMFILFLCFVPPTFSFEKCLLWYETICQDNKVDHGKLVIVDIKISLIST